MPLSSLQARANAHRSWGATRDRTARTAPGQRASDARFYTQARELLGTEATDEQVEQSARSLRSAYFTELALKSAAARRR